MYKKKGLFLFVVTNMAASWKNTSVQYPENCSYSPSLMYLSSNKSFPQ